MKNKSNFKDEAKHSSGFLLWQVTTLWQREIKQALDVIHLTHSSFVILASLLWFKEQKITVTQTTIIEHSKLDKMTVSKNLKSLEIHNYVLRDENKEDTRAKTILLTDEGMSLTIDAIKIVESVDNKFFSKLELEDKQKLNSLFDELL